MKSEKIKQLNDWLKDSLPGNLEIEITDLENNCVKGKMPVNKKTSQPFGLLHGGASAAFAETLGSLGSYTLIDKNKFIPIGIEINASHIQKASESFVYGEAKLLRESNKLHVWDIKIFNHQNQLICSARHTVIIVEKK